MSRRSTPLLPQSRDGASQRSRRLAALDPSHAPVDERTSADLLRFVREYAAQLRFLQPGGDNGALRSGTTWADFATSPELDISVEDVAAYLEDPGRFAGDRARWLGRPHFALLLAFVELLGRAREHLNGFTRRHLDHQYRDLLQLRPQAPMPDRATVILGLGSGVAEVRLPAGTELQAGRDADGKARIYRTEREIAVNRARVASLRSVFVDRRFTGIPDVRANRSLTSSQALEGSLRIAIGEPRPGDEVPSWGKEKVDFGFLLGLRGPLSFAWEELRLQHHELRSLMRLVRQRVAGAEWGEINRLMGVADTANPRDFSGNLESRVGALDFAADGLPQVNSVDDLYTYRADALPEPGVRAYIESRLAPIGYDNFVKMMQLKRRVDAEWAEINRLLERMGRRQRGLLEWSLPPGDPTDFTGNLARALEWTATPPRRPAPWPWAVAAKDVDQYERKLRELEEHLSMPVERLQALAAFAAEIARQDESRGEPLDWSEVDRVLADAHREKARAGRRARLRQARDGRDDPDGFDAMARLALGETRPSAEAQPIAWSDARQRLARCLDAARLDLLSRFREGLGTTLPLSGFGWADAERLFELAWRNAAGLPEPVARKVEVRNVYAYEDATEAQDATGASPGWRTLGERPPGAVEEQPQGARIGWALRSPLLSLSEGTRALTLTLGLRQEGFDRGAFLEALGWALGVSPDGWNEEKVAGALAAALALEVSTAKGWIEPGVTSAKLVSGLPGDDYWSLRGAPRTTGEDRPALQLGIVIDVSRDAIAPLEGSTDRWPSLRLTLRPRWDEASKEWWTAIQAFEPLVLSAVHLEVEVEGLSAFRLQQEDRLLDPRKPFEPFGSRPAAGASLYVAHPELVRARLEKLRFDLEWMGLPARLKDHYFNYPGITSSDVFQVRISLVDRNVELPLGDRALFQGASDGATGARASLSVGDVPEAIEKAAPGYPYAGRNDLPAAGDVRQASRHFRWDLTPVDFGHGLYPSLAATWARNLAVDIAAGLVQDKDKAKQYRVDAPYTPLIRRLTASYTSSIEIDPAREDPDHRILHVHPFGAGPIGTARPELFPRYDMAGELYVGVADLRPPQHLSLLVQLAEGTSDPDVKPAAVSWSYLSGERFEDLSGRIVHDSTSGLINSGIVELSLPEAASTGRLPTDLYWLRVAIPRSPTGVCDAVAIRAQAVSARFEDRGNAASHYEQPLPVGAIQRLVEPESRIAKIEQPYSSTGGKPGEKPELFDTRVSERLRHKQRALSAWDYERLVLQRFTEIYKAKCLSTGAGVDVVVIPDVRELHPRDTFAPRAPANLLAEIQRYLAERAPSTARVRVRNARYVPVQVRLGVRFQEGLDEELARRRLNDDLVRFLSPWAFDEGAELMIGGKIYANSILDFADRREYVDYAAEIKLFWSRDGKDFRLVPPVVGDYHVEAGAPDEVLVAAPRHHFDVIPETGYQQSSFTGIDYARIELDFIVSSSSGERA